MPDDVVVTRSDLGGAFPATPFYLSGDVEKFLTKAHRRQPQLRKYLDRIARVGIEDFMGEGRPVQSEGAGVLRIGDIGERRLQRILGFTDSGDFIAIDWFLKKGQDRGKRGSDRVERVAGVRKSGAWRRASREGQ